MEGRQQGRNARSSVSEEAELLILKFLVEKHPSFATFCNGGKEELLGGPNTKLRVAAVRKKKYFRSLLIEEPKRFAKILNQRGAMDLFHIFIADQQGLADFHRATCNENRPARSTAAVDVAVPPTRPPLGAWPNALAASVAPGHATRQALVPAMPMVGPTFPAYQLFGGLVHNLSNQTQLQLQNAAVQFANARVSSENTAVQLENSRAINEAFRASREIAAVQLENAKASKRAAELVATMRSKEEEELSG